MSWTADDVPTGGEVPRRRRVGLGRLVIRGALEQHRVAAAGGRAVDVRAEHRPVPRLHRNFLSDSYVETGHRPTPFACSGVIALPGPGAAVGRVFPEFCLILLPFVPVSRNCDAWGQIDTILVHKKA